MLDWFRWVLAEHGQPLLMLVIISIVVGWGFRIGWLFADLIRRKRDK